MRTLQQAVLSMQPGTPNRRSLATKPLDRAYSTCDPITYLSKGVYKDRKRRLLGVKAGFGIQRIMREVVRDRSDNSLSPAAANFPKQKPPLPQPGQTPALKSSA